MTVPAYDLATRRRLATEFPPAAQPADVPTTFERTYAGSVDMRRRLRRALTVYAARQIGFWQFSILIVVLGGVGVGVTARNQPAWYVLLLVAIIVFGALVMPLRITWAARQAADAYGRDAQRYSASFTKDAIFWQTDEATYEISWASIDRSVVLNHVTVVTIKSSRAIGVFPDELISETARARLMDINEQHRELS